MIEISRSNVDEVTKLTPVPEGARRVLDLGGCHGLYSVALCRAHSGLSAEVLDLAPDRRYFDETVAARGMSNRVHFRIPSHLAHDVVEPDTVPLLVLGWPAYWCRSGIESQTSPLYTHPSSAAVSCCASRSSANP